MSISMIRLLGRMSPASRRYLHRSARSRQTRLPARAGRTAFAGDPTLTAQLNLDILNRKGSRRKTAEQPSAS
jgi:hypothetical protein